MRIVSRKELSELPPGTVYTKYSLYEDIPCFCIKQSTIAPGDWYFQELLNIEADTPKEEYRILQRAEIDSAFEFNLDPFRETREECFDEDDRFVVFSKEDIRKMITVLQQALD